MTTVLLQGDAKDVLRGLPSNFFHCAVTSPPYFGLRKYDGGQEVWDGDSNCQHNWIVGVSRLGNENRNGLSGGVVSARSELHGKGEQPIAFCSLCGAWRGQLGAEPTPELYIRHLVEICREVRRVLRPDGVFWFNIGDSWNANYRGGGADTSTRKQLSNQGTLDFMARGQSKLDGVKPLDVVLIPEQLTIALRADGWYVRSILIWAKGVSLSDEFNGNPMPESVNGWRWERHRIKVKPADPSVRGRRGADPAETRPFKDGILGLGKYPELVAQWQDCSGCPKCSPHGGYVLRKGSWRPTDSYEYILMLTNTGHYYCDREAVVEPITNTTKNRIKSGLNHRHPADVGVAIPPVHTEVMGERFGRNSGRNLRSVLMVPTTGSKVKHYAVYPPQLIEPLIKAATSEKGCCPKCGSPWARVIDRSVRVLTDDEKRLYGTNRDGGYTGQDTKDYNVGKAQSPSDTKRRVLESIATDKLTVGWLPTCSCYPVSSVSDPIPCRVLDPFSGAGTTALVCERLGLDSIGVDTSAEYIALSKTRLAEDREKRLAEFIKQAKNSGKKIAAKK